MSAPRGTADGLCAVTLSQKFSDDVSVAYAISLTHRSLFAMLLLMLRVVDFLGPELTFENRNFSEFLIIFSYFCRYTDENNNNVQKIV